jgi:hypothetical protein
MLPPRQRETVAVREVLLRNPESACIAYGNASVDRGLLKRC